MALYQINCYSEKEQISLTNYADLIIADSAYNIVGMRFGGYPEQVMAMTDAIAAGCTIHTGDDNSREIFFSKPYSNFSRKTTHDGVYAESVMFLKDSDIRIIEDGGKKEESSPRTMYLYCRTNDKNELFEALDNKLSIPLISDFADYLIDSLTKKNILEKLNVISESFDITAYRLTVKEDESDVVKILADGLKTGKIKIPGNFIGKDIFTDIKGFSDYLNQFGKLIGERIKESFKPLFDPEKEKICTELRSVNDYVNKNVGYELFDAQLAAAEGLKRERH